MIEVISKLGIDWKLLIAQVVNFLIVFVVLKKLLWPKISAVLEERANKIKEGLKLRQVFQEKLEKLEAERKDIILQAQIQADEIIKEAEKKAKEQSKKIIEEAYIEKEKIILNAKKQAEIIKEKALLEAQRDFGTILKMALAKIIPQLEKEGIILEKFSNFFKKDYDQGHP